MLVIIGSILSIYYICIFFSICAIFDLRLHYICVKLQWTLAFLRFSVCVVLILINLVMIHFHNNVERLEGLFFLKNTSLR